MSRRVSQLMKDIRDSDVIDRMMRSRGVDLVVPGADARLVHLTASGGLVAQVRPVRATSSDHIRMSSPNRKASEAKMRHHRIKR